MQDHPRISPQRTVVKAQSTLLHALSNKVCCPCSARYYIPKYLDFLTTILVQVRQRDRSRRQAHSTSLFSNLRQLLFRSLEMPLAHQTCEIETPQVPQSLDLEEIVNPYLTQRWNALFTSSKALAIASKTATLVWALLLAFVVAWICKLVSWSTTALLDARFRYIIPWLNSGLTNPAIRTSEWLKAWGFGVGFSVAVVCIPATLIITGWPIAAGPGIPEVIALLNGSLLSDCYELSTLFVKLAGLIAVVGSGLFSGTDGPLSHIGAILSIQVMLHLTPLVISARRKIVGTREGGTSELEATNSTDALEPNESHGPGQTVQANSSSNAGQFATIEDRFVTRTRRSHLAINEAGYGAAAAFAATFRTPIGAICFILEEAITHFFPSMIIYTMVVTTSAYVFALVIDYIITQTKLNQSSLWSTNARCSAQSSAWSVLISIPMGIVFGLIGVLYIEAVLGIKKLRFKITKRPDFVGTTLRRAVDLLLVILITNSVVLFVPTLPWFQDCTYRSSSFDVVLEAARNLNCNFVCSNGRTTLNAACPFQQDIDRASFETQICLPEEAASAILVQVYGNFAAFDSQCLSNPNSTQPAYILGGNITFLESAFQSWSARNLRWFHGNSSSSQCFYQLQSLMWNPPRYIIGNLMLRGLYSLFSPTVLVSFTILYTCLSMLLYGICLPTDLIDPNLVVGASLGRLIGVGVNAASYP
jgi:H+/Cl- antiporter ClcA